MGSDLCFATYLESLHPRVWVREALSSITQDTETSAMNLLKREASPFLLVSFCPWWGMGITVILPRVHAPFPGFVHHRPSLRLRPQLPNFTSAKGIIFYLFPSTCPWQLSPLTLPTGNSNCFIQTCMRLVGLTNWYFIVFQFIEVIKESHIGPLARVFFLYKQLLSLHPTLIPGSDPESGGFQTKTAEKSHLLHYLDFSLTTDWFHDTYTFSSVHASNCNSRNRKNTARITSSGTLCTGFHFLWWP